MLEYQIEILFPLITYRLQGKKRTSPWSTLASPLESRDKHSVPCAPYVMGYKDTTCMKHHCKGFRLNLTKPIEMTFFIEEELTKQHEKAARKGQNVHSSHSSCLRL